MKPTIKPLTTTEYIVPISKNYEVSYLDLTKETITV